MALDYLVPIDMHGLEVLNHRLHMLASAPTFNEGNIYFDSTNHNPVVQVTKGATNAERSLIADDDDFHNRLSTVTTTEASDEIIIWDVSATAADHKQNYRKITRSNFLSGYSTILNAYYRVIADSGTVNLDASGADDIAITGDGTILTTVGSTPSPNTLTITWSAQNANLILAGPSSGGAAVPTFRALVDNDMPTSYNPTNWDSAYTHSTLTSGNPHSVTIGDLGYAVVTTVGDPGSDTNLASEKAIRTAIGSAVTNGMTYKGGYDASTNTPDLDTSPSGVLTGDTYTVTADGLFFTAQVRAGDMLIAETDNASVEADWTIVNRNWDETFLELGDTPSSFTSSANYFVRVNSTPNALEFVAASSINLGDFNNNLSSLTPGEGISGSAYNGSAAKTFALDINGLTNAGTTVGSTDLFAYYDATTNARVEKITWANILTQLNSDLTYIAGNNTDTLVQGPGAGQDQYAIIWDNTNSRYTLGTFASGATSFVGLTDTPGNYTSAANKLVIVNSTPDGLIFSAITDFTALTTINDADNFLVELSAGGLRKSTFSNLKSELWADLTINNISDVTITSVNDDHILVWDTSAFVNKKAKYSTVINGNDVATTFDVVHSLNTEDVVVQVWDETTDEVVYAGVKKKAAATTTTVTITFATAPASGQNYKVIVYGWA